MSTIKKEKPSAAGTAKQAGIRQIIRGAVAWMSVIGLLGVVGGMERGSIGEPTGVIWLTALMAGFVWGCKPWMR